MVRIVDYVITAKQPLFTVSDDDTGIIRTFRREYDDGISKIVDAVKEGMAESVKEHRQKNIRIVK
jgi:hypothetical protein